MALPRLNNWGFWLLPPAAILLTLPFTLALFGVGDGAIATGWTFYAPLSVQGGMGVDFAILAVHILGISSIMGSINIIVTIFNMRAPGMTMMKLPLFAWGWLRLADHRLPADRYAAGPRRRSDHAAHRPPLRHAFLRRRRRW